MAALSLRFVKADPAFLPQTNRSQRSVIPCSSSNRTWAVLSIPIRWNSRASRDMLYSVGSRGINDYFVCKQDDWIGCCWIRKVLSISLNSIFVSRVKDEMKGFYRSSCVARGSSRERRAFSLEINRKLSIHDKVRNKELQRWKLGFHQMNISFELLTEQKSDREIV